MPRCRQARGTGGVSVVGLVKRDETRALRNPAQLPELDRHFHRGLDRGRTVVTEKHAGESSGWKEPREASGKFRRRGIRRSQEGNVGDAGELIADGPGDSRVPVAVDICPDRGIAVDILAAAAVPENCSIAFDEDDRRMLIRAPCFHLGEGMPAMGLVHGGQGFCIPNVSHVSLTLQPSAGSVCRNWESS